MVTVTKRLNPCYVIRNGCEYGVVAINTGEHSATVMAESSFGSYCYHWSSTGDDPIKFLRSISMDYAMTKFLGRSYDVFDHDGQERHLKQEVIKLRRSREIDKTPAMYAWEDIRQVCQFCSTENEYHMALSQSSLMETLYDHDHSAVHICRMPDPQAVGFWETIWKPLMQFLNDDLCEDEGCDHHGTEHVCINKTGAQHGQAPVPAVVQPVTQPVAGPPD